MQLQLYVNRRRDQLDASIRAALGLPPCELNWRSPIASCAYKEFKDAQFLEALGLDELRPALRRFWPASGPRWDGLARFSTSTAEGVVLIEAKNYPREVRGGGCKAGETGGARGRIRSALTSTAVRLGVGAADHWMGPLYQYANRLAHVVFLRDHGVNAYLVNVCFFDDPNQRRRTSEAVWRAAAHDLKREVGFDGPPPWLADVFLPARDRAELLAPEQPG